MVNYMFLLDGADLDKRSGNAALALRNAVRLDELADRKAVGRSGPDCRRVTFGNPSLSDLT
jgi:hypothetical protein